MGRAYFTRPQSLALSMVGQYIYSGRGAYSQAFTVKFTRLSAAHVAEWVRQLHVDPVVPGSNPAGPEFFFNQFFFYPPKLRYKRLRLVSLSG